MKEKYSTVNPKKGFIKREDWEEYSDIETDGSFPILQERLENEANENSVRELLEILDEDLQEQENEHWYWNHSLLEEDY